MILIAGIGNIFLGDDAFGVEVVRRLALRPLPADVHVRDFGIRGIDLTYALMDDYESAILVDAAPRGEPPGTLYVIEPEAAESGEAISAMQMLDLHNLDPAKVLHLVKSLGGRLGRVLVVGCEPLTLGTGDQMPTGLSAPVEAAVDEAIVLIESLVANLQGQSKSSPSAEKRAAAALLIKN